ncbi:MAG: hypothetical protein Q9222_007443, partial [Ikaeria aurantiellina]
MPSSNGLSPYSIEPTSMPEVEKLVQELYLPGSPQAISEIQSSLQRLQRSQNGWQLADSLLQSHDEKVRFFGVLTFTIKINSDCQGDAVSYDDRAISSSRPQILGNVPKLEKSQLQTVLWFSTALVEEVGKTNPGNVKTSAWAVYAHEASIDKADQVTPLRSLLPLTLQLLWHDDVFEVTADCLADIMAAFPAFLVPEDLDQLALFLTSARGQRLLSSMVNGDVDPDAVASARLLLAYGDVRVQTLAQQPNDPIVQLVMHQLIQLLACEGFAGAEDDICSPAMEFWSAYTDYLLDSFLNAEVDEPWMDSAQQYLLQALEHCWAKVRMPPEDVFTQWSADAKGDFLNFRADVEDLLQSAYTLLGPTFFNHLATYASQALEQHAWLHLEATLFCLNAISESISDDDVVDETLADLFSSPLFPSMTDLTLPIPPRTKQTAVATIIGFTAFFERRTQFLPPMLNFLFGVLQNPNLAGTSARAICSICESCCKSLVLEVDAFIQQYDILLSWQGIESNTKERVIGAISAIIQAIPSDERKIETFSRLLEFVEQDVQACHELARVGRPGEAHDKGHCALQSLASAGKSLQEPPDIAVDLESDDANVNIYQNHPWISIHQRIVQCIYTVSNTLPSDGDIIEASCQVLRTGFKETSAGPFVFDPKVTVDFVTSSDLHTPGLDILLDNPINEPELSSSCIDLATNYIPNYLHSFLSPQCQCQIGGLVLFTIRSMISHDIMPRISATAFWAALFDRLDVVGHVRTMVNNILEQYGPQAATVIINSIGGEAARSELENFANPLRKMVFAQPRAKQWLSSALFSNTFPSSKVKEEEKRIWLQQVM